MSDGSESTISDDDFDEAFREFDQDGSGAIEKSEMLRFIKQVTGGL